MALTPQRWALALLLGALLLTVAYLPPKDITEIRSRGTMFAYASHVNQRSALSMAAERWALLSEREALARTPVERDDPVILFRDSVEAQNRQDLTAAVQGLWRAVPNGDSTVHLRVVVWGRHNWNSFTAAIERPQVVLPEQTDGHTCLVIVHPAWFGTSDRADLRSWFRRAMARAIAPCVYRRAFGAPGPQIGLWLESRQYDIGLSVGWATGGSGLDSEWWYEGFEDNVAESTELSRRIVGILPTPYLYSRAAAACAGGRSASCTAVALATGRKVAATGVVRLQPWNWGGAPPFSRATDRYLSSLIQERGAASFARFWASPLAVDSAFAQVYGEPIGRYTQRWMVTREGALDLGAAIHPAGAIAGLLLALVVVGVASLTARTREMS